MKPCTWSWWFVALWSSELKKDTTSFKPYLFHTKILQLTRITPGKRKKQVCEHKIKKTNLNCFAIECGFMKWFAIYISNSIVSFERTKKAGIVRFPSFFTSAGLPGDLPLLPGAGLEDDQNQDRGGAPQHQPGSLPGHVR